MPLQTALQNHQNDIIINTQHSILIGVVDLWNRTKTPQEPDFIASLVANTVPYWAVYLNGLFSLYGVSISVLSVFCHQNPQVKYSLNSKTETCEVGDILFVHFHKDKTGFIYRNALLYQAKMSSAQPYVVPKTEYHQLELYRHWPTVEYIKSGSLNGQKRDVHPKMPHLGGQYLLIDDRGPSHPHSGVAGLPGTFPFGSCIANDILYIRNDLAVELFHFLGLGSGKAFLEKGSKVADGWSELVWDLISVGIAKAFNRKNSGYSNVPRISGWNLGKMDGVSYVSAPKLPIHSVAEQVLGKAKAAELYASIANGDNGTNIRNEDLAFADDNSGTSLVVIETGETAEG